MYKWIDSFIPELLRQRTEDLFRARAFVQYVLVYLVLCLAVLLAMYISPERSAKALLMTLSATAPLCLFFILLLLILRQTVNLLLCARLLLFFSSVFCLFGLMITGGASLSPIQPMLFLPMVMAVCMLGFKEGSAWLLCTASAYLILWWLELEGLLLPMQFMEARHMPVNTVFTWVVAAVCIWAILATFERLNYSLGMERDEHNQRLEVLASTDELTKIANRRTFELVLNNTLERNRRYKTRFALFYLDLDDFKQINDQYGHVVGDEILVLAAQRLQASLRDMDLVARIGGDEFAIIVDNVAIQEQAQQLQEKILAFFVEPMQTSGGAIQVHTSIGFSLYPDTAECSENLRIQADRAMYSCKENRKQLAVSAL